MKGLGKRKLMLKVDMKGRKTRESLEGKQIGRGEEKGQSKKGGTARERIEWTGKVRMRQ